MIRRGRTEGWLKQPIEALPRWAAFHGVSFEGIRIGPLPGFENRGSTVIADRELEGGKVEPLLVVPRDLIISRQNIEVLAKADRNLREVLDVLGDFGTTTRGAVLMFLLIQATICCPDTKNVGVLNPLTEYVKFLPDELLPTFWTEDEQELLTGTTLRPAVRAKLSSLLREFETVRTATESIGWCSKYWWDDDTGMLTFDDWLRVDAMYRSRALEFPGVGDCMVPCVDMANHASGETTAALYEADDDGNGLLLLREGKKVGKTSEITITYGDDKGACENVFSYGFLEDSMISAQVMFLDLDIPDDDPLRPAKIFVSTAAPGFRIFEDKKNGTIDWESDFIWLVIINEEDGLDFKIRQTIDGKKEIQAFWKDRELDDTLKLKEYLQDEPLWDIFKLRATVLLQNRVETQIETLQEMQSVKRETSIREIPWSLAKRLRSLELDMLQRAEATLESQKSTLIESEVVQRYLGMAGDDEEEVDFT
ncbi:SET domain-containing protein [Dothidotthia symphoricarpi CBS 119687]|uniref:SET domain-containing protein n=1 Tax=Dothidotthia symphoricarpi CBS 119687 TaxID=1392245 RepID=A0A6A6A819_9PLEO|nr:SET domain-containing protein [Dothidotthia symphoricarpi CBS 119687]KAF2126801.1 SET domain-containing protein [Dothidotthia symphoricarpi CBS 119687]